MIKNLTSHQLLLITLAAVLFLLAAFSFYLLQDPSAPLPFAPLQATRTFPPSPALIIITRPSDTAQPTRQTSYTPFATYLTSPSTAALESPTITPIQSGTITPGILTPTRSTTPVPSRTSSITTAATTTMTGTLETGAVGITGRMLRYGTPVANAVIEFKDDVAPRMSITNSSGHYWFTSQAPGTSFSLTFRQSANPQLTPVADITSLAWIEGTLPTGVNPISLPDFEVSINPNGIIFDLQAPLDGTSYYASVVSASNPIQFVWSLYSLGGSYHIELGSTGSNDPIWTSAQIASSNFMWNGSLDDGTHISQGAYWWRVAVTKNLGNYVVVIFTQPWDILFNP